MWPGHLPPILSSWALNFNHKVSISFSTTGYTYNLLHWGGGGSRVPSWRLFIAFLVNPKETLLKKKKLVFGVQY